MRSAALGRPGDESLERLRSELLAQKAELDRQQEELYRAHAAQKAALDEYTRLFDFAPISYFVIAASGSIRWANYAGARLVGIDRSRLPGLRLAAYVVSPDLGPFERLLAATLAGPGDREEGPTSLTLRVNGSLRHVRLKASKLPRPDDEPPSVLLAAEDTTELKSADDHLREAVERYERQVRLFDGVASTTPDFVYVFDPQGRFLYANHRLLEVWGMQLPDVVGRSCRELGYEQWHHDMHMREIAEVIATKRPIKGEVPFKAPLTGIFGVYEYIFTPVIGPAGEVELVAGTTRDVTQRKRTEEALERATERLSDVLNGMRAANARLVEADRRKDDFLAMLGHELRNPLAPICNAAFVLERADPNGEQAKRARGILRRQSEHLTRLVDDLLDVTRITRGKIALRRARVSMRDLLLRAAEDIRPAMEEKGIAFRVDVPPEDVRAFVDGTRLGQVLANLLHNASKFSRRGDEVVVSLRENGGAAEIRVRDTGAGIDPAVLPHIFEPFVQADRTLARSEGGLGLGLALVKGVVELHGGDVRAESAGIGKGTEFVVSVPLQEAANAAAASGAASGAVSRGARRVLVVDDNEDAAESLADILRMSGHDVDVAHDGPTALDKLESRRPEVVLCDIGLPGMDGYEVARAMRANGGRDLKLVALSGYAQPDHVKRAIEAGFDAHVAKPPDPDDLAGLLA